MQTLRRLALGALRALAAVGIACTKIPAGSVPAGDVVGLQGKQTDNPVTHRVERIQPDGEGGWTISMKGGDKAIPDALDGRRLEAGGAVGRLGDRRSAHGGTPASALPLVIGLLGLRGPAVSIPAPVRARAPRGAGIATAEGAAA